MGTLPFCFQRIMAYKKDEPKATSKPGRLVYRMTMIDGKSYELTAETMPEMIDVGQAKCREIGMKFGDDVKEWQRI